MGRLGTGIDYVKEPDQERWGRWYQDQMQARLVALWLLDAFSDDESVMTQLVQNPELGEEACKVALDVLRVVVNKRARATAVEAPLKALRIMGLRHKAAALAQERQKKGVRFAVQGEKHPGARLSESQVREIFALSHQNEMSRFDIANKFSVSPAMVSLIRHGRTWKHLKLGQGEETDDGRKKLTAEMVREIYTMTHNGINHAEIAVQFGIHRSVVCRIQTGKAWRKITEGKAE